MEQKISRWFIPVYVVAAVEEMLSLAVAKATGKEHHSSVSRWRGLLFGLVTEFGFASRPAANFLSEICWIQRENYTRQSGDSCARCSWITLIATDSTYVSDCWMSSYICNILVQQPEIAYYVSNFMQYELWSHIYRHASMLYAPCTNSKRIACRFFRKSTKALFPQPGSQLSHRKRNIT